VRTPGKHRAKPPSRGIPYCWNSIQKFLVVSGTVAAMVIAWVAVSTGPTRSRSAAGTTGGSAADTDRSRAGPVTGACTASYYRTGQRTASGETYDPDGLTAAHRTLPFGSVIRVTNRTTGDSVVVRVNDRGPFARREVRCLDLSRAAMAAIGGITAGVVPVRYQVLDQA
jgi:rare lipoprotein A (peptidoglycan hydrolase)